jgi:ribosome modulation factor
MPDLFSEIYGKAYLQGYHAMQGGQRRDQNPYGRIEILARGGWDDGYDDAAIEKLEAEEHGYHLQRSMQN